MYHYDYVSEKEYMPKKKEVISIIDSLRYYVGYYVTFSYCFIGSTAHNMITKDYNTNGWFDFDLNMYVNDKNKNYEPGEIRKIIIEGLKRALDDKFYFFRLVLDPNYGYRIENSTRVITVKIFDKDNKSHIFYSFDIAIVHDCELYSKPAQQYIRYNKKKNYYSWEYQPKGYYLDDKIDWLKKEKLWDEVRDLYLYKKNHNNDIVNKKSRSLFAETINELCHQYGYNK